MSVLRQILNGWGNTVLDEFSLLPPHIKAQSAKRLSICDGCEMRKNNSCNSSSFGINIKTGEMVKGCGCNLAAKSMSTEPDTKCPLDKW